MRQTKRVAAIALFAATLLGVTQAPAATLTFDFESALPAPFTLVDAPPFVGPGNCLEGSCLKVNRNGTDTLSIMDSLTFSVTSFWFQLLGTGDDLLVQTSKGSITLLESVYANNTGFTFDATLTAIFQDITFLSFVMDTEGNGRIDDIVVTHDAPSPVPLPAAGMLLVGALGALAALRRRKTA